jgi:uncharacterized membrane protein YvlD (DUF360 family)
MVNENFGWISIFLAVTMGLWMGIKFQGEEWLGGYGALARRMVRLAHIALAALGMINIEFGHSVQELALSPRLLRSASFAFIVAGVSMPACCLLIAKNFRRFELFALPVGSLAIALLLTIGGLLR